MTLDGRVLTVTPQAVTAVAGTDAQLFVALAQTGFTTAVNAGENRGETLRNDHVVREWSGPLPLAGGNVRWTLPAGAAPERLTVIAFAAERDSGRPLQATSLPLAACLK